MKSLVRRLYRKLWLFLAQHPHFVEDLLHLCHTTHILLH